MLKLVDRPGLKSVKRDLVTSRKVSKKYRMRRVHKKEYKKLRAIVPAVAKKDKVSKVTVIEEAIKYIDELHEALIERIQESTSAMGMKGAEQMVMSQRILKNLVLSNLRPLTDVRPSSFAFERPNSRNDLYWRTGSAPQAPMS